MASIIPPEDGSFDPLNSGLFIVTLRLGKKVLIFSSEIFCGEDSLVSTFIVKVPTG